MKHYTRLAALLLCVVLLFSFTACETRSGTQSGATSPSPTEPPVPSASDIYTQARDTLAGTKDITLDITVTTYTTVNGEEFSEKSVMTVAYQGIGTEDFAAQMDSKMTYGIHFDDMDEEALDETEIPYRETYTGGTLYVQADETYLFSSAIEAGEAAARFIPPALLDASLYGSVTSEETPDGTKILFAQATAGESWALPENSKLTEATGSALLSSDGAITQMDYTVSFTYGTAQVRMEVSSLPASQAVAVTVPEKAEDYTVLQAPDAPYLSLRSHAMLAQSNSVSTSDFEITVSQAAGYMQNQSVSIDLHGRKKDTQVKVETNVSATDYSSKEDYEYKLEEKFVDGRFTVTTNDGLPSTAPGVSWKDIREFTDENLGQYNTPMEYWSDVTVTDMGTVYLLEFTLNEMFGNTKQNEICSALFDDPSALINISSKYETAEATGYLSVDKFTGLPVAGGYSYEGIHTIQGTDCSLTKQYDQSITAPHWGAYQEITDELPEEPEPEVKPAPVFYHVTGQDGQEMWLFGTIHIGDERTAYLPQEIRDAFEASDALALECDTEAFDEQVENDEKLQEEIADAYFYTDGTTLESLMEEEDYARAVQFLKATGNYSPNMLYAKPYIWSNAIESFYRQQAQMYHSQQGVEERLMDWAEELGTPIREIESNLFQIQMITDYSDELQLLLLAAAMEAPGADQWNATNELYELWCAGDEAALREAISYQIDTEELSEEDLADYEQYKDLIDEYNQSMSYDRNENMLKVAIEYLESGDVVFYAVGLAHILDDTNGLVDALRNAGYTVELVVYQ